MLWVLTAGTLVACATTPPSPRLRACPAFDRAAVLPADTHTYDTLSLSDQPRIRGTLRPVHYPVRLRERGIQGRVVLGYVIDENGFVDPATIRVLSTTHLGFVEAAVDGLVGISYCPGIRDGRRVRVRVQMPVNFTITRG